MLSNKRSLLARFTTPVVFLLACLFAYASVIYVSVSIPLEDTRLGYTEPVQLSQGWASQTADGMTELAEASRPAAGCIHETLTLVNVLPASISDDTALCFQTKNESVRVFVDDTLIYTYGETPQLAYGHGVGAVWNMAQLPRASAGKGVTIELTPIDDRTGLAPYQFLLDNQGDVFLYLLQSKNAMTAICLTLLIIGIASLLLALLGVIRHNRWVATSALYFSVFVLLSAVWTATDSGLMQFLIQNKGVSYMMFGCSFYLLCTPFALFIASMLPEHRKLFHILAAVNALYAIVRIALYVSGLVDFEAALWVLHLLMGALIISINIAIWLPVIRKKKAKQIELYLGVTALTLIAGVSLISFYIYDKMDQLRCGYSSGFYVGILLFVLIMIVGVIRQTRLIRQRAFQAEFFERRAYVDDLTELLNVKGFDDKCAALIREADDGSCYAVVDFDVNFFSQYNANNGLDAGDELLRLIAAQLKAYCRPDELCARQEADHFVCLLHDASFDAILARIRKADARVHNHMTARMLLLSYGVVEVTDRGLSAAALRNQALVAKRTVKGNYETNIAIYDRELHDAQLHEVALLSGFESALRRGEYVIFLQPKINVATERLAGAEALVRRITPDGNITAAGPIIEALERKGFVAKLDYYILGRVCQFQRRCLADGRPVCPVSSNFSRMHLYDPDFPVKVAEMVDSYELPHELIEIELTETAFLAGKDALRSMVQRLHSYDFKVSIDDFGSGYSSLNILKDVEVDVIKLDREFLADFADNARASTIIENTINLAQNMRITSVAEGIETPEQLAFLRRLGCDVVQGYYYSQPLPEDEFIAKYLPNAG